MQNKIILNFLFIKLENIFKRKIPSVSRGYRKYAQYLVDKSIKSCNFSKEQINNFYKCPLKCLYSFNLTLPFWGIYVNEKSSGCYNHLAVTIVLESIP